MDVLLIWAKCFLNKRRGKNWCFMVKDGRDAHSRIRKYDALWLVQYSWPMESAMSISKRGEGHEDWNWK